MPISEYYLELKETKYYSLMTQAIFWIYLTISWVVFVIQKIELKIVILRCDTSMKTCYPGHTDRNTYLFCLTYRRRYYNIYKLKHRI